MMWHSVRNYLIHLFKSKPVGWYPMLAVYYLTYACDFRCPYCSDGNNVPYHQLPRSDLPAKEVLKLLSNIRRHSDYVVITGGEPLNHEQCTAVLEGLPALGFDGVVLTTNGYDVEPYLPLINKAVHHLVFSLDTLDHTKADNWFGVGSGTLDKILKNMQLAAALPDRKYDILISAVATPDNLEDLPDVFNYCFGRGFRFALAPQLMGVKPHPELKGSKAYRKVYEVLIAAKKSGVPVYGTVPYLKYMRDLRAFHCHPSTLLAVAPNGDVFYPCLERGTIAGNLLRTPHLHTLRKQGERKFGPEPRCDNRCHSACALGFALVLDQPFSMIQEACLSMLMYFKAKRGKHAIQLDKTV